MQPSLAITDLGGTPTTSEISTTLPVGAGVAFEIFADAVHVPRWLPIVISAHVIERSSEGRATLVSFVGRQKHGSLNYTLRYTYDPDTLSVAWRTAESSSLRIDGETRFLPLSARACLMVYRLTIDTPTGAVWSDAEYDGHPASAAVADFREHLKRLG